MKFLLDTHLLLWAAAFELDPPDRLPPEAYVLLNDPANEVCFSAANIWEITIKHALGRADFATDPHVLRRSALLSGYTELPITSDHGLAVGTLPLVHRDPFDRILIAQASVENITLLTSDPLMASYPGPIRRV
jgi:PIN domain nuclease of toxin-antitoxin system